MKNLLIPLLVAFATEPVRAQFSIDWFKVAGGGYTSTGGGYAATDTVGQANAIQMTGGQFRLVSGFWSFSAPDRTWRAGTDHRRDRNQHDTYLLAVAVDRLRVREEYGPGRQQLANRVASAGGQRNRQVPHCSPGPPRILPTGEVKLLAPKDPEITHNSDPPKKL
jgi:hypothetical protein